ncbi:MAG: zinc-binding dehydrogenase [Abditibacteriales bacterium]|nr:zinc-binding dehydrogenase [Abditibacteriales bacterium]MDW8366711.1 zinc-binding dehydrogenase [Abditibacteriales bacterium]
MQALILTDIGRCELQEKPPPQAGPGQLLVKMRLCSIGAEHVYSWKGECCYVVPSPRNPYYRGFPLPLNGEMVGEVVEVGTGVDGWEVGERVCGWTAFQEYVVIGAAGALRVPPAVRDEEAVFVPWGATTLHAVHRAQILLGDSVVVLGQGPLGLLVTQWAKLSGADDLIAVDVRDSRLALAKQLGATHVINAAKTDVHAQVLALTDGQGADVVIEASGVPAVAADAVAVARTKARVVFLGWYQTPVTLPHWVADVYHKELDLIATRATGFGDQYFPIEKSTSGRNLRTVLKYIADGKVNVKPIVSHVLPVARYEEALQLEADKPEGALKVLLQW